MNETAEPIALEEVPTAKRAPSAESRELKARVQKLRIGGPSARGKSFLSGVTWLPWILCAVLALAWAGVGLRTYNAGPRDDVGPVTAPTSSGSGSNSSGGNSSAGIAIAPVKGYLVPAQQIVPRPVRA